MKFAALIFVAFVAFVAAAAAPAVDVDVDGRKENPKAQTKPPEPVDSQ